MELLRRRRRSGPEVITQAASKLVVRSQRFGAVAAALEHQHQPPVPRIAIGSDVHERPRSALGAVELGVPDLEAGFGDQLETSFVRSAESPPVVVQPGRLLTREQVTCGHVLDDAGRAPRSGPVATSDRPLGSMQSLAHCLDVDPGVGGKHEVEL